MNDLLVHRCTTAANRLIREAGVHFTYQMPTDKPTGRMPGEHKTTYSKPIECTEPIAPVNSQSANALANAQNGTATDYQFVWISHRDVPMKTRVKRNNQYYTVIDKGDYRSFSNTFVYYLKGRSDIK